MFLRTFLISFLAATFIVNSLQTEKPTPEELQKVWLQALKTKAWRSTVEELKQKVAPFLTASSQAPPKQALELTTEDHQENLQFIEEPTTLTPKIPVKVPPEIQSASELLGDVYSGVINLGGYFTTQIILNDRKAMEYYLLASTPAAYRRVAFILLHPRDGRAPKSKIDVAKALVYYDFAARGGDVEAQIVLGYRYFYGHNLPKSCQLAVEHLDKAASKVVKTAKERNIKFMSDEVRLSEEQVNGRDRISEEQDIVQFYKYSADTGDVEAQVTMGLFYRQGGIDSPSDALKAFQYFSSAAAKGDSVAMANLGYMYAHGVGTESDNDTAINLLRQAADKGSSHAQTFLGELYLKGHGIKPNTPLAKKLFMKAAQQNYPEALFHLGNMYFEGTIIDKRDYAQALGYYQRAATLGHLGALYKMGQMNKLGLGTVSYCPNAFKLLKKVLERGYISHFTKEAYNYYRNGNEEMALVAYERASDMGLELAQSNVAWLYEEKKNYSLALGFYRDAAELESAEAHLKLGDFYYYGLGTSSNLEKAASYYLVASELRNPQSTFNLGVMHQFGLGLPVDFHLAKRYYDMALEQSPDAYLPVSIALLGLSAHQLYENIPTQIWGYDWDTIAICVCVFLLVILGYVRQRFFVQR